MRILLGFCLWAAALPAFAQAPFASFDMASEPVLNDPHDLAFGPDGRLYVADKFNNRVTVMDPKTLTVVGTFGDGQLAGAHDISFGPDGTVYVAATGVDAVVSYGFLDGTASLDRALGPFPRTEGVLAHSNGMLYVMASGTGQLVAMQNDTPLNAVGGLFGAHDVAEALDGSIWVADNNAARLVQFSPDLKVLSILDDARYGFIGPRYMDFDDFGHIVVADQDAHRILKIDPISGDLLGVIGDGLPGLGPNKFDDPEGVAVRGNSYYFADSDNNRIVRYVVVTN